MSEYPRPERVRDRYPEFVIDLNFQWPNDGSVVHLPEGHPDEKPFPARWSVERYGDVDIWAMDEDEARAEAAATTKRIDDAWVRTREGPIQPAVLRLIVDLDDE